MLEIIGLLEYKSSIPLFIFHFILHQSQLATFFFSFLIKQLRFKKKKKKNQTQSYT
jgi:hypothetical protein